MSELCDKSGPEKGSYYSWNVCAVASTRIWCLTCVTNWMTYAITSHYAQLTNAVANKGPLISRTCPCITQVFVVLLPAIPHAMPRQCFSHFVPIVVVAEFVKSNDASE